ncbi:MAG: DNA/RNA non-specific endonuclease [Alloprevotella sp.]|nr:DNA/RNA non-specific endonuclease [Alloprevotella sp.]
MRYSCNLKSSIRFSMLRIYSTVALFVFLVVFAGCSSESEITTETARVAFNATLSQNGVVNAWEPGSQIGVYMSPAGEGIANAYNGARNARFTATGSQGHFSSDAEVYYPADGSAVDFVAYYPYQPSLSGTTIPIDISNQAQAAQFDLLYSNNLRGRGASVSAPTLTFKHALSKVTFPLRSTGGVDLSTAKVTLLDVPTSGTFNLSDGTITPSSTTGDIELPLTAGTTVRTATALLLPQSGAVIKLRLEIEGREPIEHSLSTNATLRQDNELEYSITLSSGGSSGPGQGSTIIGGYVELPAMSSSQLAQSNIKYITHSFTYNSKVYRSYEMLYDTDLKMAYWVAYPLCNFYTNGSTGRTDAWAYDPALSETQQANLSGGISGYDRGHQIPSADRQVCSEANAQTFYYTNMTPQLGNGLNQSIWANLEMAVRGWSSNVDTLYVVTGAMPTSPSNTSISYARDRSGQQICVPKYYFKALCRVNRSTGQAYTIAFKLDHKNYSSGDSYRNYALSVKDLENLTGFTFFPTIDAQYKSSYNLSLWN